MKTVLKQGKIFLFDNPCVWDMVYQDLFHMFLSFEISMRTV